MNLLSTWMGEQLEKADSVNQRKIKVNLAMIVNDNQKAPFSIATTPKCRVGCYSFPWIAPLYP